jgi:hypothetical protein
MLRVPTFLAVSTLLGTAACTGSGPTSSSCPDGKCDGFDLPEDEVPDTPCDGIMFDKSGRGLGTSKIAGRLGDPVAQLVFGRGDECPTSFSDIAAKLKAAEATEELSCSADSARTMVVTETAQVLAEPTSYRAVTAFDCDQPVEDDEDDADGGIGIPPFRNPVPGALFSSFGLSLGADLPSNVEIIGFDASRGVFNYYETDGDTINFFGTSADMLQGPGQGGDRRCANCHVTGGLVMKELAAPWLHWEGDTTTPGASDLIAEHAETFGSQSDGIEMESITLAGNQEWNRTRFELLREATSTREVLRPLFCTEQVNIRNASSSPGDSRSGDVASLPLSGPLFRETLGFGSFRDFLPEQYDAVIRANGQRLEGLPAEFIETHFGLAHIVEGEVNLGYRDVLIDEGVLDRPLIAAVDAVDLTRPVFSEDRCGLLEHVPALTSDQLTADNVRQGLIDNLRAAGAAPGTAEGELLRNLEGDAEKIGSDAATRFKAACEARTDTVTVQSMEVPGFLVDYMRVVSLVRNQARALEVFEFPTTLPTDHLSVAPGTRFDPNTCQLTEELAPIAVGGG